VRIEMVERPHGFCFELYPECMEDQVLLVRFGMNSVKKVNTIGVYAYNDKTMYGVMDIGKSKRPYSRVK
jgi:hypothetical protein